MKLNAGPQPPALGLEAEGRDFKFQKILKILKILKTYIGPELNFNRTL